MGKKTEEKTDGKSSSTRGNKADKGSANSGQRPIRPKANAQSASSAHSSSGKFSEPKPTQRGQSSTSQQSAQNRDSTPSGSTLVKNRSPPSLEKPGKPQKRLNLEEQSSKVDLEIENPNLVNNSSSITRNNAMDDTTRQHEDLEQKNVTDGIRGNSTPTLATSNNDGEEPMSEDHECATRENNTSKNTVATGSNIGDESMHEEHECITGENNTLRESKNIETKVNNPFETDDCEDDGECLDDLEPELAKMGRILAREITKSLSKALIPLQNEINDLKTTNQSAGSIEQWQQLREENDKLNMKVHQLELRNHKLQQKLNRIEDKLVDNNLLFFGISEMEGESEQDRYGVVLEVISSTYIGQTHEI